MSLEIFIPEVLFDEIRINTFSESTYSLLQKNYETIEKQSFRSKYCHATVLKLKEYDQDFISICNGEFWKYYFLDYDFDRQSFISSGRKILSPQMMDEEIQSIQKNFAYITKELSSTKLLTLSKKQTIRSKIDETFFTLSGILFLLYSFKEKTLENTQLLENIDEKNIEMSAQAELLQETNKTKILEIQSQIDKFEWKVELFFQTIHKLFL